VAPELFDSEPTSDNENPEFFDHKGDVLIDKFADGVATLSRSGAGRGLPTMLGNYAMQSPMDLYTLRYTDLDYSLPYSRAIIDCLYIIGFCLLAFPSIVTVVAVIRFLTSV
jgi:hypothetical protein